jgi:hypothetical protein
VPFLLQKFIGGNYMKNSKLNGMEILPINLQLFADDAGDIDDGQDGVVDYPNDDVSDDSEGEYSNELDDTQGSEDEEGSKAQEVADPDKSKQPKEENAQFQKMRLRAEEEARKKLEAEKAKLDADRAELEAFKRQKEQSEIEQKHYNEITPDVIQAVATQYGVTEDFAKAFLTEQAKNNANQELATRQLKMSQSQIQKSELKDKPYFKDLEPDIDKLIVSNPDVDVKTAYKYLIGENLERLMKQTKSQTEKQTIANMQDNARRRSIPSGASDGLDVGSVLSQDGIEMANAFGNDPKKIAQRVKETLKTTKRR